MLRSTFNSVTRVQCNLVTSGLAPNVTYCEPQRASVRAGRLEISCESGPHASALRLRNCKVSAVRLTASVRFLVPGLCLGTQHSRSSASLRNASETRMLDDSASRACKSMGSKVEPWNQSVTSGEKYRSVIVLVLVLIGLVPSVHSFEGTVRTIRQRSRFKARSFHFWSNTASLAMGMVSPKRIFTWTSTRMIYH